METARVRYAAFILALCLAGCATTEGPLDEMTDATRPLVLEKLRGAGGEARLIVGDKYYIVRAQALQPEIKALGSATADAVEARIPPREHEDDSLQESKPVIAMSRVDRAMLAGDVAIEAVGSGASRNYRVTLRIGEERYLWLDVGRTDRIDRAFDTLVSTAAAEACTWYGWNMDGGIRLFYGGVDVVGCGGAGPPSLEDGGAAR